MGLPQGCGRLSGDICRLNKRLDGLKQTSRQWHAFMDIVVYPGTVTERLCRRR